MKSHHFVNAPSVLPIRELAGQAPYARAVQALIPHSIRLKSFLLLPAAHCNKGEAVVRDGFSIILGITGHAQTGRLFRDSQAFSQSSLAPSKEGEAR